jgi:hypothetical protein
LATLESLSSLLEFEVYPHGEIDSDWLMVRHGGKVSPLLHSEQRGFLKSQARTIAFQHL